MTFITMTEKEMNKMLIIKSLLDKKIDLETAQKKLNVGERTIYRYIKKVKEYWKPQSIYVDRHATYKVNNGNKDMFDEEKLTRFSKAM